MLQLNLIMNDKKEITMKVFSQATIILKSPTEEQVFTKISCVTDTLPYPKCGATDEAISVLVGLDSPNPDEEYSTIIYPCGYVLGKERCFKDQARKEGFIE